MKAPSPQEVSALLQAWGNGDREAFDKLVPLVHDELHRLAHRYMARERAGHSLQTSALVNEAYFRLISVKNVKCQDRAHFLAISANVMRCILVDYARMHHSYKRIPSNMKVPISEGIPIFRRPDPDLVKLDDALNTFAQLHPRKARVVELKFFGGFDLDEMAEVLKVSRDTVKSDWSFAKVWLFAELKERGQDED